MLRLTAVLIALPVVALIVLWEGAKAAGRELSEFTAPYVGPDL